MSQAYAVNITFDRTVFNEPQFFPAIRNRYWSVARSLSDLLRPSRLFAPLSSSMCPSAVLWSSQQLTSLQTFTQHNGHPARRDMGRIAFRTCQAQTQQCRSRSQRQSQEPSSHAPAAMQFSRRDTVVAAILALQLPAMLPWNAAHALG